MLRDRTVFNIQDPQRLYSLISWIDLLISHACLWCWYNLPFSYFVQNHAGCMIRSWPTRPLFVTWPWLWLLMHWNLFHLCGKISIGPVHWLEQSLAKNSHDFLLVIIQTLHGFYSAILYSCHWEISELWKHSASKALFITLKK